MANQTTHETEAGSRRPFVRSTGAWGGLFDASLILALVASTACLITVCAQLGVALGAAP